MPGQDFRIDPHLWKTLTPAQQSALTWRLVRRARAARSRAIGEALLAAVGEVRQRLTVFPQPRPSPLPRGAGSWPRPASRGKDF